MNLEKVSKYLSLILRHKPEEIGITLDAHGYAKTSEIISGIKRKYPEFNRNILEEIVRTDSKQRYSFKDYGRMIRANQGHSIPVDLGLKEVAPPDILYHGTSGKSIPSILNSKAILPMSRQHVHLSADTTTAYTVGERHCSHDVQICVINAKQMREEGYKFYLSENNVWLTDKVPYEYFIIVSVTQTNHKTKIDKYLKNLEW